MKTEEEKTRVCSLLKCLHWECFLFFFFFFQRWDLKGVDRRSHVRKMITSDLKGNHTYCKPKCKSKCHPFMLFHLHHFTAKCGLHTHALCVCVCVWAGPSLRSIISRHRISYAFCHSITPRLCLYTTLPFVMTGFLSEHSNWNTFLNYGTFVLCFVVGACSTVSEATTQRITLTVVLALLYFSEGAVTQTEVLSLLVIQSWCKWFLKWKDRAGKKKTKKKQPIDFLKMSLLRDQMFRFLNKHLVRGLELRFVESYRSLRNKLKGALWSFGEVIIP